MKTTIDAPSRIGMRSSRRLATKTRIDPIRTPRGASGRSADPHVVEGPEPAVSVHESVHLGAEALGGQVVDHESPGRVVHHDLLDLLGEPDSLLQRRPQRLVVDGVDLRIVVEADVPDAVRRMPDLAEEDSPPRVSPQAPG